MAILAKIGFFDATNHPLLEESNRPTYRIFLNELLNVNNTTSKAKINGEESGGHDDELISRLMMLGQCKEELAVKILKTIKLVFDTYAL